MVSDWKECKHKELKYYEQTDRVVCLECGEIFETAEECDCSCTDNTGSSSTWTNVPYKPRYTTYC